MVQAKSICLRARKMGCLDRGGGTGEAREPLGSPFLDLSCHFQKYKAKICRTNGSKVTVSIIN